MIFKKILGAFLLGMISLVVIGCSSTMTTISLENTTEEITTEEITLAPGEEYILTEQNLLEASEIDDNYRVYYEVYVGSFSDSNSDGVGDFQGVINRLDYLNDGDFSSGKSLGVTGIWFMPIMPSPSYHKYDTTNYKGIDPEFGSMNDFEALLDETDERGINVIIDLVLNHTSNQHPWFLAAKEAVRTGDMENQYVEYYTLVTEAEKETGKTYYPFEGELYYEGNFSSSMPELNLDSTYVRDEIVDIISFWLNKGVDGFRLDAVKYPYYNDHPKNIAFWDWFMAEVKSVREDAYVVGEMWDSEDNIIDYYEAMSNFDFGMSQQTGAVSLTIKNIETVNDYVDYLYDYRNAVTAVNPDAILQPFLSNHDMNRAAGFFTVDDYQMHMAANLYILTYGTPFIYYGEEIGARGTRGSEPTDANRRLIFNWGDGDTVENPPGATWTIDIQTNGSLLDQIGKSDSLYNHYKKLLLLRQANPEIARGIYTPLIFEAYDTFGGFLSTYHNSTVGVFHNTSYTSLTIDLSIYTEFEFSVLRGYVGMSNATLNGQTLTIGPMTSVVLK